jgi:hypothetical protein
MSEMAIVSVGKMRGYTDERQMAYLNLEDAVDEFKKRKGRWA